MPTQPATPPVRRPQAVKERRRYASPGSSDNKPVYHFKPRAYKGNFVPEEKKSLPLPSFAKRMVTFAVRFLRWE